MRSTLKKVSGGENKYYKYAFQNVDQESFNLRLYTNSRDH